jgi:hypothetical protein
MLAVASVAASCGTSPVDGARATTGVANEAAATTTLSVPVDPVPMAVDPRLPALERLEAASDLLMVGTVEAVGPAVANTLDGNVPLSSRAALDRTVPLTQVALRIEAIPGVRPSGAVTQPLVVGGLVQVTLRQGTLTFTTTAADRARLGMRTFNDDDQAKVVETGGDQMLTRASSDFVRLDVGSRYALYLYAEHLQRADQPSDTMPILTLASITIGVVRMAGDTPSGHPLLMAEGLTRDALADSGHRLTAATGPPTRFSPGAEGAGQ